MRLLAAFAAAGSLAACGAEEPRAVSPQIVEAAAARAQSQAGRPAGPAPVRVAETKR